MLGHMHVHIITMHGSLIRRAASTVKEHMHGHITCRSGWSQQGIKAANCAADRPQHASCMIVRSCSHLQHSDDAVHVVQNACLAALGAEGVAVPQGAPACAPQTEASQAVPLEADGESQIRPAWVAEPAALGAQCCQQAAAYRFGWDPCRSLIRQPQTNLQ